MFKRLAIPLLLVLAAVLAYLYLRPVPQIRPVSQIISLPQSQPVSLPWPAAGQAAIGAGGYGLLASHNATTPAPIASITKIITALAVLKQKPLAPGSQGPQLTLDNIDVDLFNYYYTNDGSVAQVQAGEKISEYQALQAVLLPSANNMSDSLARWAFGSIDAYLSYANTMVKDMGLKHTVVASTNGFSDKTMSTAEDLVTLGIAAMQDPVVSQIVGQTTADLPVAGTVKNVNWLLGTDGVNGIKTGNTDKAGGCYLFSAERDVAGKKITLIGAVVGQPQLNDAISAARPLIQASDKGFTQVKLAAKGRVFGTYSAPWGASAHAVAANDASAVIWKERALEISGGPLAVKPPAAGGSPAGEVSVTDAGQAESIKLVLDQKLNSPPWYWRIFHK